MAQLPHRETVDRIFQELRSKNDDLRQRAALELRQSLDLAYRDLPTERFAEYYAQVNSRVSSLVVQGNDTSERIGGIHALAQLIDFKGDDVAQKTTRFAGYLRTVLRGNDRSAMVLASRALGQLAVPGGTLTAELVESETKAALEHLQTDQQENRRFAAVLTLRELARNAPTLLYAWVEAIFKVIWVALRDKLILIRESAAEAVNECLKIVTARDSALRDKLLAFMYDQTLVGFQQNSTESIHGSLLVLKALLEYGGMFMGGDSERYQEACETIIRYKDHREALIRKQVVATIPDLAKYSPQAFKNGYLHKFMIHLQGLLKKEKDRGPAFVAVGQIAYYMTGDMQPYLDGIISYIREGLLLRSRNKTLDEGPIFQCLGMMAYAVGQALSKYMSQIFDPMLDCGLSEPLIQALTDMLHYVPPMKSMIQERLLNMISQVLCGRPFVPIGSPVHGSLPPPPVFHKDSKDPQFIEHKEAEITSALQTLGNFDFSGYVLNEFLRDVVVRYVEDDNPDIRRAAALSCCQLFVNDPIMHQSSRHSIAVVSTVIEKLLTVAVADVEHNIRHEVLLALAPRFDRYLAKPENVRTLFVALHDEYFPIREAAMSIIGRLTSVNPAYVFPSLRKVLIQLLTEMEYSNNPQNKEQSAKLISHLVTASSKLLKPYVQPIVTVLLAKVRDPNPEVAATSLRAIGDLSVVGGKDMLRWVPELMVVIIHNLQDLSSPLKRSAALQALSQLASNSGYVIDPYAEHPELLSVLTNIVKTESASPLRRETIRLMGVLGALDPYKHQQMMEATPENNLAADSDNFVDVTLVMTGLTPSSDDFYPTVVITSLVNVLKDPSLVHFHSAVVDAIMTIYATLGLKCVTFLPQVVPEILKVMRSAPLGRFEGYFNQLSQLVKIVRQHIRPFLKEILSLILDHWSTSPQMQATILSLIEAIARSLEGEFKVYLASVLPLLLGVLEKDVHPKRIPSERVLQAFLVFGSSAEEYMHLIIPAIVRLFEKPAQPPNTRKLAIETIGKMSRQVNISEFAARIIHPLSRVLRGNDAALKQTALDTLCALIFQLGPDYIHFIPTINKILVTHRVPHSNYALVASKLQRGEPLPQDLSPDERYGCQYDDQGITDIATKKLPVNQQHLKDAWDAKQKTTREDWQEWIRRLSLELLRESPQQALRACTSLASVYTPIARTLFNSAFVSCWNELYPDYQEDLIRSLETAMSSPNMPPEIMQIVLTLSEFTEHDDKPLPMHLPTLGMYAGKCHAYAKALHYKELEFQAEQQESLVETLISINNQLRQTDAAFGLLRRAQGYQDVQLKETWFEKLERWEDALIAYQRREVEEPNSLEVTMGKMRCLHALGEWEVLSSLAQDKWQQASIDYRRLIAPLAAAAAWGLGQWEIMGNYLDAMKVHSPDRSFFGAILNIHKNDFAHAQADIEKARDGLDIELSGLLAESYSRAYPVIVRIQMLAELEEIIAYKHNIGNSEKREAMRQTWTKRLNGCQRNVEVWQRMLKVRALVISPKENMNMWIKFASLCRKANRGGLAEKALHNLIGPQADIYNISQEHGVPYEVEYAVCKFLWSTQEHYHGALTQLRDFTARLADELQIRVSEVNGSQTNGINGANGINGFHLPNGVPTDQTPSKDLNKWSKLLARCYLKLGEWQTVLQGGNWQHDNVQEVLESYHAATQYNKTSHKAWHAWALANFEVVTSITSQTDRETADISQQVIRDHVIPAIRGFFKSIALSPPAKILQDTLRLLTLWFAHGTYDEINAEVIAGIPTVSVETWLAVIPQLIARINQPTPRVRQAIHNLLCDVGKSHPQALVYPLTVSMKSDIIRRSRLAAAVMDNMRQHSPKLVEQAELVSHELVRIGVLWHELWHEGLEEASRLYFGDNNVDGMIATLAPLHNMIDKGPETLREISFIQSFGRELQEARDWCMTYRRTVDVGDLNQAWDLYYGIFKRIARQLPQVMTLELQYVSPKLKAAHDLVLALPGYYDPSKPPVTISHFDPVPTVIQSKQRPRKLAIVGSDGQRHYYLLKGHEDIRQDERVMQLFGLINTLLASDTESSKRHLNIERYPAIPLSTQSGLLGWVPNADTFHVLIREYRESRKILLNIEHRIMLQMAPDYDNLTLMQKVEVFGYSLDNTTGQDLYRVLWLKSTNSEIWLERRTNYTRSLGVMSMVGYILGLGDRHPSNLMLDRVTGKVIHIDFGDCFEVAMHREKYPERVPFRLTRMLTTAMEISNIEGSFRVTSEAVMRVLRDNKESIMAVLEAFIHDPLLTWRVFASEHHSLPPTSHFPPSNRPQDRRGSIMGAPVSDDPNVIGPDNRPPSSYRPRTRSSLLGSHEKAVNGVNATEQPDDDAKEVQNARAVQVLNRIKEKLTGKDFKTVEGLRVPEQVDMLVAEATSLENLCQHYIGWCSFW